MFTNKITTITGSPSFFEKISDYLLKTNQILNINKIFIGGAPVFPKLAYKIIKSFPQTETNVIYGSTEVIPISMTNIKNISPKSKETGLFVGKPIDEIQLKLIVPQNNPIKLKPNEKLDSFCVDKNQDGEIIVFSKHCLKSYFNSKEAFENNKIVEKNNKTFVSVKIHKDFFINYAYVGKLNVKINQTISPYTELFFGSKNNPLKKNSIIIFIMKNNKIVDPTFMCR